MLALAEFGRYVKNLQSLETVDGHKERITQSHKRHRTRAAFLASFRYDHILSMVLVITAAASSNLEVPSVIQAREFQLVGEDGQIRAELKSHGSNNTQLRLYDGSGKSEVSIAANEQRAIVNLKHDQRTNRAVIEAHNLGAEVASQRKREGKSTGAYCRRSGRNVRQVETYHCGEISIPETK